MLTRGEQVTHEFTYHLAATPGVVGLSILEAGGRVSDYKCNGWHERTWAG